MSHFYSRIQGSKGAATRCGTRGSGISAEATGWGIGTLSIIRYDLELDTDVVYIYLTDGSNGNNKTLLTTVYKAPDGSHKFLSANLPTPIL